MITQSRRISRFNHSCATNCEALFDNLANIRVLVKKDILPVSGEEMTINYLPPDCVTGSLLVPAPHRSAGRF